MSDDGALRSLKRIWAPGRARPRLLVALGVAGLLARVVLWCVTEGTNDIRTWARFAMAIDVYGLDGTYLRDPTFNHPPLMGLLAQATWHVAPRLGATFGRSFKVYSMLAELGIALLLAAIWRRRAKPEQAAAAFAAYGWALCCILVSAYHGNTDPVYWFLVLAAVYLMQDRDAPFFAGLALGAALNVKLIPVLVALPLAACSRSLRAFVRFAAGGLLAVVPFVGLVLSFAPEGRAAFVRNVFGYGSYRENWGIELIERALIAAFQTSAPPIAIAVYDVGNVYARHGSQILLACTTALAVYQLATRRTRLDAYALAALCFCLFLVLAQGFGVQYLGAVVPLLLAVRIRDGFAFATMAGLFIALIYASFVRTWSPVYSEHNYFSPAFAAPAFATWWLLVRISARIWRSRGPSRPRSFGGSDSAL